MQFLADDPTIYDRRGGRGVRAAHRLSQRRARQLHEIVRRARQPGRPHAGRLFPPMRHRDVVPRNWRWPGASCAPSGRNPSTGLQVIQAERARRINAVMLTCGHYDGSGEFAYRVGLPGKSGVGGGILAIAPGKASIAVWSPGLDRRRQFASRAHRARSAAPSEWSGRSSTARFRCAAVGLDGLVPVIPAVCRT